MEESSIIAVIDDDESVREGLSDLFRAMGFAPVVFSRAVDFLSSDQIDHTKCLIVDVQMPEMSGIELHRRLSQSGRTIPTILITAYPDERDRWNALQAGVLCYLVKPYDHEELLACVESAVASQAKMREA